jgi:uncharacterized membrane protein YhaH (DUF805 family)
MSWYILVWKRAFDFAGRSRRKEFWMFMLFTCLVSFCLSFLGHLLLPDSIAFTLIAIYLVAVIVPSLSLNIRRLHDIDRSGFWLFLLLIPVVGPLVIFVFNVMQGVPCSNQYGADPKAE